MLQVEARGNFVWERKADASLFSKKSFRTKRSKSLTHLLVFACPKSDWNDKRCSSKMRLVMVKHPKPEFKTLCSKGRCSVRGSRFRI